ncbi:ATP-dependent RNA helicase DBP10 [Mycena sanguinolenta]|uniref:RNA helicase n=1 Tax=Mycena sanguinolenta TaxID=230812 RepID=A0A8H6ZIH8_9AGAR|nr:ATP-dependent RNA helicase DBP10 [Mycena sanguinolenta]
MLAKRRRSSESDTDSSDSEHIDISAALAGKRQRTLPQPDDDSDADLGNFIRTSIAKRDVKNGTEIVKKVKGKTKLAKGEVGGGSFQSMGLHPSLLRSLTLQGYRIPTPIQRLSIPALLENPPRDLVGMARTGSGKSLAYMVPLVQRLSGRHSTAFGARALILLPTRELALQILKVGKELARGWRAGAGGHAGDAEEVEDSSKGESLRWSLIVGGEGLDEQFEMITSNPDIIIATPGRLLHLIVEMNLDLKSVQYVVFDEADRLFEMGFETALNEILHRLPASRQTLLFSATLPKSLVEFAKAGLQNPKLVRLDAESKISPDLKMAFFSVKQAEKDACLLAILRDVIKVPFGTGATSEGDAIVTDVAARGIDIPVLENVINYDFPQGARVFVHRVGRTARAGRQGWAWSFVTNTELPYLLDLQLFLGRPLKADVSSDGDQEYTESLILGTFEREKIDEDVEYIRSLEDANHSLPILREVMKRGHTMYERSKGKASPPSYKRAKEMTKDPKWILAGSDSGVHPVLLRGDDGAQRRAREEARKILLRSVNTFRPSETVFEVGSKGNTANAALMKDRRKALQRSQRRLSASVLATEADSEPEAGPTGGEVEMANEDELAAVFETRKQDYKDSEFYMSHYQKDAMTEKGYSLNDGASFAEQARGATFDLTGDEGVAERKRRQLQWDKKKKRFVKGDGVGADNIKLVKTEGGTRLPATYRSGRFDEWKAKSRIALPKVGEAENAGPQKRRPVGIGGQRFRHNQVAAPKPLDKLSHDYERKARQMKKKAESQQEEQSSRPTSARRSKGGRYGGKPVGEDQD